MATPVRFDDLRELVRTTYGGTLPEFDANTPVTLEEVTAWINAAVRRYYGLLLELKADEYTTFEELITVSGATFDTSTLTAARFHEVRKAQWVRGARDIVDIWPATPERWYQRSETAETWGSTCDPVYQLVRGLLYFMPVPSSSVSVRLWYAGIPADLVADADSIDGGPGWEDFVVADVCLNIARSQEEDEGRWTTMMADARTTIRGQKKRDRSAARQVRDSRGVRPETRRVRRLPRWP